MLKILFITLLAAFIGPAFGSAFMNHEKFVHLPTADKKRIAIAVMQLVVEIEGRYRHQIRTGASTETLERYRHFLRTVSNLLISEAHAARPSTYGEYVQQLRALTTENGKCIYAGWISRLGPDNLCTHPSRGSHAQQYVNEPGCGANRITCNPAIFGFRNVTQKTLFCVDAGTGRADNSAKNCMNEALRETAPGASSKEERIQNIVAGMEARREDANAVFDFLVQACACDPARSPQINASYVERIRPHQTCYGILRMISEIAPRCTPAGQPFEQNQLDFLSGIRNLLNDSEMRGSGDSVRNLYTSRLAALRTSDEAFRNAETAVCGGEQTDSCPEPRRRNNNLACCAETEVASEDKLTCTAAPVECPEPRRRINNLACCAETEVASEDKLTCEPQDSSGEPSLSVSGTEKDANTFTVTGSVSGGERNQFTIFWYRKGGGTLTFTDPSARSSGPALTRDPEEEAPPTVTLPAVSAGETQISISGSVDSFDAPRATEDYQVCGKLIRNTGSAVIGNESCTTIAKKVAPRAPANRGGMNPFMQQPMMPTRGGASDAIFRGVR